MSDPQKPIARLIVRLKEGHEVSLDYADITLLARQLEQLQKKPNPFSTFALHEFDNGQGTTLAFAQQNYVDHRIVEIEPSRSESREAQREAPAF